MPSDAPQDELTQACLIELVGRTQNGRCIVGIYGLGYAGLPLALCFAEVGKRVLSLHLGRSKFDYEALTENGLLVVDTRGRIQGAQVINA